MEDTLRQEDALVTARSKVDHRLLPFLTLLYVLSFLDRTNIGFAQDRLQADVGLSNAAYAFGVSAFFLGYAFLEVPSNIVLASVGARAWLTRIMISWGIVLAAMVFVTGEVSFYILRLLLGVCEAGFFPGVIFYLTQWYPTRDRARAIGLFYFGAPLSFILGGPLSGLLLDMDGIYGLAGWQWMFMINGIVASAVGLWTWFYLADTPVDARWLSPAEKVAIINSMTDAEPPKRERLSHVFQAMANRQVLLLALIYLLIQMSVYGVIFFLPKQVAGLMHAHVGLLVGAVSALPWACALVATWLVPRWAQQAGRLREAAAGLLTVAGIGIAASIATGSALTGLVALSFATSGFIAAQPIFWGVAASLLTGTRAAAAIALINSAGAVGAFIAPNARVFADAAIPDLPQAGMCLLSLLTLTGGALMLTVPRRAIAT